MKKISLMEKTLFLILIMCAVMCGRAGAREQAKAAPDGKTLKIGVKVSPPFSMMNGNGKWTGISIDLWRHAAERLGLKYEFVEYKNVKELLDGVSRGPLDAAMAAITITAEREETLDFTHPYYTAGLGIAVRPRPSSGLMHAIKPFLSMDFLYGAALFFLTVFIVGAIVAFFERKRNPDQFGGGFAKGVWSGFWWSIVSMTTVGYGDKSPVSAVGRILAVAWMFMGIIMISGFTATITTRLTVSQLETSIKGPEDLPSAVSGTVPGSTSEAYLEKENLAYKKFPAIEAGLDALADGKIDVFVYDAPMLRYMAHTTYRGQIVTLRHTFQPQAYGIALKQTSALREPLNRAILAETSGPDWRKIVERFMGK